MTERILPPSEWQRLNALGFQDIWPTWNPDDVRVCVVEDERGEIVDHWVAIRFWHVEALRVHAPHSFRRLWRLMSKTLSTLGATVVWTGADYDNEVVPEFIIRMGGQPVPIEHFILPVSSPTHRNEPCH